MKKSFISVMFFLSLFLGVSTPAFSSTVLFYELTGTIHGGTVEILKSLLKQAAEKKNDAVLIELDTPGGLLDATEEMVKLILNSEIPILVFVAPSGAKAGSAGTFITMAAHVAAMAPGTYIGAAHPVMMFGGGGEKNDPDDLMKKKIESATSSFIETIAKQRGRNEAWAKKAVLQSESLTEDKAFKEHVIDFVAKNREDLLQKIEGLEINFPSGKRAIDLTQASLILYQISPALRFLNWLANPTLIYLLILGMIAGIYLEVSHPGMIVPGVFSGVCLIFVLIATRTLPLNGVGLFLLVIALVLLVAEIYVTSYGLLTVAALFSFVMGSLLLFDPKETDLFVPLSYIAGSASGLAIIAICIAIAVLKTSRKPQRGGKESLVGLKGIIVEPMMPRKQGLIEIHGEFWNAVSPEIFEKGEGAEIVSSEGLLLHVKRISS